MRHSRWFLIAVVVALATACRPAFAAGDGSVLIGRWVGLSQRMDSAPDRCVLELTTVKNRRLQGTLEIVPCVFPVDVTISAAGIFNGGGEEEDGDRVRFHGKVSAFGDGSVRLAAIQFKVFEADGSVRTGFAVFGLLLPAVQTGPDIAGEWSGIYTSADRPGGGCLEASLRNGRDQTSSDVFGNVMFEDFPLGDRMADLSFDVLGTVGLPAVQKGSANFILIGLSQPASGGETNGIIAVLIGLLLPAVQDQPSMLQGNYRLYSSLQDLYVDLVGGRGSVLDKGSFELPAVQ